MKRTANPQGLGNQSRESSPTTILPQMTGEAKDLEPNMEVVKVEFTQDELMWVAEAAATVEENMMRIRRERIEDGTWGEEDRAALFTLIQANEKLIRAMG